MTFYTYATTGSTHEHGGSTAFLHIVPTGPYYQGAFPPLFTSAAACQQWIDHPPEGVYVPCNAEIVSLEVHDG